jgi:hypothetical protein
MRQSQTPARANGHSWPLAPFTPELEKLKLDRALRRKKNMRSSRSLPDEENRALSLPDRRTTTYVPSGM